MLRRLIICSIRFIGYRRFEGAGIEKFIGLPVHLRVIVEGIDNRFCGDHSSWRPLNLLRELGACPIGTGNYWWNL